MKNTSCAQALHSPWKIVSTTFLFGMKLIRKKTLNYTQLQQHTQNLTTSCDINTTSMTELDSTANIFQTLLNKRQRNSPMRFRNGAHWPVLLPQQSYCTYETRHLNRIHLQCFGNCGCQISPFFQKQEWLPDKTVRFSRAHMTFHTFCSNMTYHHDGVAKSLVQKHQTMFVCNKPGCMQNITT